MSGRETIREGDRCPIQPYNAIDLTKRVLVNGSELPLRACFSEKFVTWEVADPETMRSILVFTEKAARHNSSRRT